MAWLTPSGDTTGATDTDAIVNELSSNKVAKLEEGQW